MLASLRFLGRQGICCAAIWYGRTVRQKVQLLVCREGESHRAECVVYIITPNLHIHTSIYPSVLSVIRYHSTKNTEPNPFLIWYFVPIPLCKAQLRTKKRRNIFFRQCCTTQRNTFPSSITLSTTAHNSTQHLPSILTSSLNKTATQRKTNES